MKLKIRYEQRGQHIHATFWMGEKIMANVGKLIFRDEEWEAVEYALFAGKHAFSDLDIWGKRSE
jgi:hypothetical protein